MATYATVLDVAAEYDGCIPDDRLNYVEQKLLSAELVLSSVAGNIADRITAGKTTAEAVKLVLCNMVLRVLRNTSGIRTQTVGPFSYTLDSTVASGLLFVSREDRRLLGMRPGASSVSLSDADEALECLPVSPRECWPHPWHPVCNGGHIP